MSDSRPISTEARGKVRRFKAHIAETSAETKRIIASLDKNQVRALVKKTSVNGRARAAEKLRRVLLHVRWVSPVHEKCLLGAFLAPVEPIISNPTDIGQTQKAVSMHYIFIGLQGEDFTHPVVSSGHWTLEVPDHALGRMFERNPSINMIDTLFSAHRTLLAAAREDNPLESIFYLTAGDGLFLCEYIVCKSVVTDNYCIYARARTWLHRDQLRDDQISLPIGSPSLGENEFLPMPLRDIDVDDNGVIRVWRH